VVEGNEGLDVIGQELVDDAVVVGHAKGVERVIARGHEAAPGERQPHVAHVYGLGQLDVLLVPAGVIKVRGTLVIAVIIRTKPVIIANYLTLQSGATRGPSPLTSLVASPSASKRLPVIRVIGHVAGVAVRRLACQISRLVSWREKGQG
jgi:hypothetical protein